MKLRRIKVVNLLVDVFSSDNHYNTRSQHCCFEKTPIRTNHSRKWLKRVKIPGKMHLTKIPINKARNTWFTISVPAFILFIFRRLLLMEKFQVKVCFEMSEHDVQIVDHNSKLTSRAF